MQTIPLGSSKLISSRLAYGCWRLAQTGDTKKDLQTARDAIAAAVEAGYALFDLADIYCRGRSESAFGQVLRENPGMRKEILIATKCGIRLKDEPEGSPQRYDFSKEHILRSCEQSLRRLGVDRIDLYQLHRPDWLMDVRELAETFEKLKKEGMVREFGVSNFRPSQVGILQRALEEAQEEPLITQQIEISLAQLAPFTDGSLDQCIAQNLTPLAWSPLGAGLLGDGGKDLLPSQEGYSTSEVVTVLDEIAEARATTRAAIALAWLLKHPSKIIPIIGSTKPERIRDAAAAAEIELSRNDWYRLLTAARGEPMT